MTVVQGAVPLGAGELAGAVADRVDAGGRFAGLLATASGDGSTVLRGIVAHEGSLETVEAVLPPGARSYPSLTPSVPAASWYEREIHDLFGVAALGHPRLDPLVLPLAGPEPAFPRPGSGGDLGEVALDCSPLPAHVRGEGVFTIPYGPVRSGVFEAIEYLVESYGEDIAHLRTRVYHKHRGIERRFSALRLEDGVLLAERVEGTASVAHATAFCQALETLAGVEPPPPAALVRLLHAELERVAAHLDSVIRHTEGSGQSVAYARMSLHKERLMQLRAQLCGHRFGRGVVVPGGVSGPVLPEASEALSAVVRLEAAVSDDVRALMATPSFLDRLRRTGVLPPEAAAAHGALGPVGRGSGSTEDVRSARPYGAYGRLGFVPVEGRAEGDALARQLVRLDEMTASFRLARQALDELSRVGRESPWRQELPEVHGVAIGSVEAPQGELLYLVEAEHGRLGRVKPRTASFHNLPLLPQTFRGDILTDFVFIEASFGLSIAGVSG